MLKCWWTFRKEETVKQRWRLSKTLPGYMDGGFFYQVTKPPRLQPENSCKSLAVNIWPAAVAVCVLFAAHGCREATWMFL